MLALLLVGVVSLAYTQRGIAETPRATTGVSWNPNVNCVPVVTTFENIMETNLNSFNGGFLSGSQYATYNLKYFEQNGNGSSEPGEPVVYDVNNNGAGSPCEPLTVNPSITANFAFSPTNPAPRQKVTFSGSATGGTLSYVSWSWNFGDNSPQSSGATVAHSYSKTGFYTVRLTVTDNTGINATFTATITILENRTILELDPTFLNEVITSLGIAVATTAIGLYWKRTGRHLDSTA